MNTINNQQLPKAKKSVALSGTAAGNTALCTVGRSGNDLHYRGYDIKDLADNASFEEVAHLLVHGSLPDASQLAAYKVNKVDFPMLLDSQMTVLSYEINQAAAVVAHRKAIAEIDQLTGKSVGEAP